MGARNSCSTPIIIAWIWVILGSVSKVDTVYVELDCPKEFQEGSNSVTCKVNQTLLSSKCSRALNVVQFIYIKPDGTQVKECETPNFSFSNICPSSVSTGTNSNSTCHCEQMSGNLVKYQLNFQANKTLHDGITWICNICSSQNSVDENFTSCSNINFAAANVTKSGTNPPEWIAVPIIVGFAVILGIIFITFHYAFGCILCGKKGFVPCCKETDTPVSKCAKYVSCEQNPCSKTKPSIRKP